jgi:hypothetical protein
MYFEPFLLNFAAVKRWLRIGGEMEEKRPFPLRSIYLSIYNVNVKR